MPEGIGGAAKVDAKIVHRFLHRGINERTRRLLLLVVDLLCRLDFGFGLLYGMNRTEPKCSVIN